MRWISIMRSLYFRIFSASFFITFLCSFFIIPDYDVWFIVGDGSVGLHLLIAHLTCFYWFRYMLIPESNLPLVPDICWSVVIIIIIIYYKCCRICDAIPQSVYRLSHEVYDREIYVRYPSVSKPGQVLG
jgi:hypothetical protein